MRLASKEVRRMQTSKNVSFALFQTMVRVVISTNIGSARAYLFIYRQAGPCLSGVGRILLRAILRNRRRDGCEFQLSRFSGVYLCEINYVFIPVMI